jgi:hypothetical protein
MAAKALVRNVKKQEKRVREEDGGGGYRGGKHGVGERGNKKKSRTVKVEDLVCSNCQATGHHFRDCKEPTTCFNCHEAGHYAKNCPKGPSRYSTVIPEREAKRGGLAQSTMRIGAPGGVEARRSSQNVSGRHGGDEGADVQHAEPREDRPSQADFCFALSEAQRIQDELDKAYKTLSLFEVSVGGDTMSTVHLTNNRLLLTDVKTAEVPIVVEGISGQVELYEYGTCGPFDNVWYHPDGPVSVFSLGRAVSDGAEMSYDSYWDEFRLTKGDYELYFSKRPGCMGTLVIYLKSSVAIWIYWIIISIECSRSRCTL